MRLDLATLPALEPVPGIGIETFRVADATLVAHVFEESYRDGLAGPFDAGPDWYGVRIADPEWDASLVLIARDTATGRILGACHGWTSGFVKDLGVLAEARRHGVGEALVRAVAERYRQRGLGAMELKVVSGNAPALRLYERMGFQDV